MNPVQVVPFPGSTRVVLTGEASAMVADALEFAADDARAVVLKLHDQDREGAAIARMEARRLDLLAEAVRAGRMTLDLDDVNDDAGRTLARDLHDAWGDA